MKTRILTALAFASALALASSPSYALSFDFSITNVTGNVSGKVTGLIEGLTDNTTSAATDLIVQSYPAGMTVLPAAPFTFPTVGFNSFTVANGSITSAGFSGSLSGAQALLCISVALSSFLCTTGDAFLETSGGQILAGPITFTAVSSVPGPIAGAALPGLILASAGLLGWRRRRKKIA